jgi:Tol biopolymer transport system component/DNA-binding winged helix-turn-helix (wHTH) protein
MQVLLVLAAEPGEVFSKEDLVSSVWGNIHVSREVLTRAISELRRALDDDAKSPAIIQTIPKKGYRLLAPVSSLPSEELPGALPAPVPKPRVRFPKQQAIGLAALILAVTTPAWMRLRRPDIGPVRIRAFTTYPGSETTPAFSPDGSQVAFAWTGGEDGERHIYVKKIGSENPFQLTRGPCVDRSPAWSPDGRSIAFVRSSDEDRGVFVVPSGGGTPSKLFTPSWINDAEMSGLSWSRDGDLIAYPDRPRPGTSSAIHLYSRSNGVSRRLTTPPEGWNGDLTPVFSPDGKSLAFVRGPGSGDRDLYVISVAGGRYRRLTTFDRQVRGLAWTSDSREIVFSSNQSGEFGLWRVPSDGGQPEELRVGRESAFFPSITGNRLVYSQGSTGSSILRVSIGSQNVSTSRILASSRTESGPQISPDGGRIAFQSVRSGAPEIWLCGKGGEDPRQLTAFGDRQTGSPHWSPDGRWIAFESWRDGRSQVFVVDAQGGAPRRVSDDEWSRENTPTWSHDGHWIYAGSRRQGSWNIWRFPAQGGRPKQITTSGGLMAQESPDGRWLYYAKPSKAGVWRMPSGGGLESKVIDYPKAGYWGYWVPVNTGIYYLRNGNAGDAAVEFWEEFTGKIRAVAAFQGKPTPYLGLSVSPDAKWLIYSQANASAGDIMMAENFR